MIRRLAAILVCFAVLAAACSGDDDGGEAPAPAGSAPDIDGTVQWSRSFTRTGDPAASSGVILRTDVLASTAAGLVVVSGPTAAFSQVSVGVIDPGDGGSVWIQDVGVGLRSDVIGVVDDVVVVVARESGAEIDTVRGFDLVDGEQRWTFEAPAVTVLVVDDLVVVGSSDGTIALEPSTGVAVWSDSRRTPLGEVGAGLLSVRLSLTEPPSLALIDMATGEADWTLDVGEDAVAELRALLANAAAEALVPPAVLPLVAGDGSIRALDLETSEVSAPLQVGLSSVTDGVVEVIAIGRPDEVIVCSGDERRVRLVGVGLAAGQRPEVLFDSVLPAFQVEATSFTPQIADPGIRRLVLTGGARRPCRPDASEGFGGLAVLDSVTGDVISTADGLDRVVLDSQPVLAGLNSPVSPLVAVRETDQDSGEISWTLIDLSSGETLWRVVDTIPARVLSIVAGSVIVWEAESTTVGGLDAATGDVSWVVPLTDVDPAGERTAAADSETLYLGFGDRLVAVG